MTVGELKVLLDQYDENMKVVVKDTNKKAFCLDFVELDTKGVGVINSRYIDTNGLSNRTVYEAKSMGDSQVLTLNCKPKVY